MARSPRFIKPATMYEVVVRTLKGRKLFSPIPAITAAVLAVLGRGLALFPVEVHAFVYLSNHLHLLATFLDGEAMRGFMTHLNRNTAAAAKAITGWTGDVWDRYHPIPVLDDVASIRRMQYVLANGVKEGLVAHPLNWPGATAAHALATGNPIETEWVIRPPRGPKTQSNVVERNLIELAPLPVWARLSRADRCAQVRAMMDDIATKARQDREGKPVVGVASLRAQDPFEPTPLEQTVAPIAHASLDLVLDVYRAELESFTSAHRRSGHEQHETRRSAKYPPYGFPAALPYQGDR
jgi:REP element-mobilizing transposase RayT